MAIFAQGWFSFELPAGHPLGFAIVNALIITAFLLFATGAPMLKPFAWRPLAKLGEASYSLYLIHSVVGIVLIRQLSKVIPWPVALCLVVATMIALSRALFRWVEVPGKRLILSLTSLRPADIKLSCRRPAVSRGAGAEALPSTLPNG